jgi:small conductance mechanosensitive channel
MVSTADALRLVYEKLRGWTNAVILLLPNLLVALLILVVFTLLARVVRRALRKLLKRFAHKDVIVSLVSNTGSTSMWLLGLLIALSVLDLDKTVTSLLAGVGVLGIVLGFALQDITSNFVSGILISLHHPCDVGDLIKTGNYIGRVERIALRATTIRTFQGPIVIIPNKDLLQSPLTNFTRIPERRIELRVGVAYEDDLDKVRQVAIEAARGVKARKADREVEVYFEEFDDSSINLVIWLWIEYKGERDYVAARSDLLMRVKTAFAVNTIAIPFPIRTLELDVKGAAALTRALSKLSIEDVEDPRGHWKGSGQAASEGADVGLEGPPAPPEAPAQNKGDKGDQGDEKAPKA